MKTLSGCWTMSDCRWEPTGVRVLVKPIEIDEKSEGGIFLCAEGKDRERVGMTMGTLVDVGPEAWHDSAKPQAQIGDTVMFARHCGWAIEEGDDNELFRLMNDDDIFAKVKK